MAHVEANCRSCRGTGLYKGFAEPEGVAVVCLNCSGSGCEKIEYTPFTGRVDREGVRTVRRSKGSFIGTGVGPTGNEITYDQFRRGQMP